MLVAVPHSLSANREDADRSSDKRGLNTWLKNLERSWTKFDLVAGVKSMHVRRAKPEDRLC